MIDFMVMEAVNVKVQLEDVAAQKKAEAEAKLKSLRDTRNKENFKDLDQFR